MSIRCAASSTFLRRAESICSLVAVCLDGAGEVRPRLPGAGVGHPRGHDRSGDPETTLRYYFPNWLLTHRRRAEQALVSVVATSYLLGVSTRRVEKLVEQLGIRQLSKSQVSQMAAHLDARACQMVCVQDPF